MATSTFTQLPQPNDPYSGQPTDPQFRSLLDGTGQLSSLNKVTPQTSANQGSNQAGFQSAWAGLTPNTQGLDMYRQQATSLGPSAWANMASNQAGAQAAGSNATANASLAMQGGLNSGARERLALGGANASNAAQQGIRSQDAAQKQTMLANLPGLENTALQPGIQQANAWQSMAQNESAQNQQNQQFNVSNNLNAQNANQQQTAAQTAAGNASNLNLYNQQMAGWAAGKQADATANSGKK